MKSPQVLNEGSGDRHRTAAAEKGEEGEGHEHPHGTPDEFPK